MTEIITKAEVVARAPKAWERQYKGIIGDRWEKHRETTKQLLALPEGFTAADVDAITGNGSWTSLACDECGQEVEAVAGFGRSEYDAPSCCVCEVCIRKAGIAIRAARKAGA